MNLAHWLRRAAQVHAEQPALLRGAQVLFRYGELGERVARLAGHWRDGLGLQTGERVALYMANSPAYLDSLTKLNSHRLSQVFLRSNPCLVAP